MKFAAAALKLVLEPGGAVALAALLAGIFDARGLTVGVVLSGGNIDLAGSRASAELSNKELPPTETVSLTSLRHKAPSSHWVTRHGGEG